MIVNCFEVVVVKYLVLKVISLCLIVVLNYDYVIEFVVVKDGDEFVFIFLISGG